MKNNKLRQELSNKLKEMKVNDCFKVSDPVAETIMGIELIEIMDGECLIIGGYGNDYKSFDFNTYSIDELVENIINFLFDYETESEMNLAIGINV